MADLGYNYSAVPSDAVVPASANRSEDEYYERDAPYAEWLKWYREMEYPRYRHPDVTVDCVLLTVDEELLASRDAEESALCLKALVVDRWTHPFRGSVALPGTFMRPDDTDEEAVIARMLRDRFDFDVNDALPSVVAPALDSELAADAGAAPESASGAGSERQLSPVHIRQLKTFTGFNRDPRGQVVSIANIVYLQRGMRLIPQTEGVRWEPLLPLAEKPMAFDHSDIIATAIERMCSQFAWSPYIYWALPQPFTVTDALKLRASLFGEDYKAINRKNFKRKYQSVWVNDRVKVNPVTQMPVDFYRYEGAEF